MRNHVSTLPLALLLIQQTESFLLKSTNEKCTDPHLEMMDTPWYIYINLPQITVYSCGVIRTKIIFDRETKRHLRSDETVYHDVTRHCLDLAARKQSVERTTTSHFDAGYNITEERVVSENKARVDLQNNQIYLPSLTSCKYGAGFCYDSKLENMGYVWDTKQKLEATPSCDHLIQLKMAGRMVMKFSLHNEYLVFEGNDGNLAVRLAADVSLCGGRAWTNNAGLVVTNDTFEERGAHDERNASEFFELQDKHDLYQSLVEECQKDGIFIDLYFCSLLFLLAYVVLHFLCSMYNLLANYTTLRKVEGKWLFQSSINKFLVNNSMVAETKLRSDIEMSKISRNEMRPRPSYYEFRRAN